MQYSFRHTTEGNGMILFYSIVKKTILFFLSKNKTEIYALSSPNGLRSTNSEINAKYRDHQMARHNDPTLRLGKSTETVASGRTKEEKNIFLQKTNRKMNAEWWVRKEKTENEICKLPFHVGCPKGRAGTSSIKKERALPADCLLPVLVYDAHGRRKRHSVQHLEARGWKWGRGVGPGKWMRSDLRKAKRMVKWNGITGDSDNGHFR
ncbi:hypothetical protein CEXT_108841 [Caerostris extrusa]|uniref:HNH homing endonuclease n=1 Tax=Caerostris extrusa TaxID=172846 RepID=A0AAV4R296_CAEEX|nr:hypothetical protein CEXT_108841 [Caerostris extrusa]